MDKLADWPIWITWSGDGITCERDGCRGDTLTSRGDGTYGQLGEAIRIHAREAHGIELED